MTWTTFLSEGNEAADVQQLYRDGRVLNRPARATSKQTGTDS